jgi:signal peptidase II
MLKWLWLSVVIVTLDQISKHYAGALLQLHEPVGVMPLFNLTLMHNQGAAFSFLSSAGGWQRWFFTVLALVVSGVIVQWLRRLQSSQAGLAAALSLIVGGALGNAWDRIQLGYVVDFVDIYYGTWHWPAFNIADSAITVGAVILIIEAFREGKSGSSAL